MERFTHSGRTGGRKRAGFSIVEVVLAIGVVSVAIVALLGLMAPTLSSVKNVVDTSQATAAISKFNAWIDLEPFDTVFNTVLAQDSYFVYDRLDDNEIDATMITSSAPTNLAEVSGPIFRFVLRPSPVLRINGSAANWPEAYFPIYVDVLLEEGDSVKATANDAHIARYRILSYTTAKLR